MKGRSALDQAARGMGRVAAREQWAKKKRGADSPARLMSCYRRDAKIWSMLEARLGDYTAGYHDELLVLEEG